MYGQDGVSNNVVLNRTISEQHCCWPHHDHTLGVSSLPATKLPSVCWAFALLTTNTMQLRAAGQMKVEALTSKVGVKTTPECKSHFWQILTLADV